jgi:hypothetical protein
VPVRWFAAWLGFIARLVRRGGDQECGERRRNDAEAERVWRAN